MKVSILAIVFVLSPLSGYAQSTIRGTIQDDEGKPVPYVNVFLFGTSDGVMSDQEGKFSLVTKRAGDFELVASSVGHEKFKKKLLLQPGKTIDLPIIMNPTIIKTGEAVVKLILERKRKGCDTVLDGCDDDSRRCR
jgi:hypothetical protein